MAEIEKKKINFDLDIYTGPLIDKENNLYVYLKAKFPAWHEVNDNFEFECYPLNQRIEVDLSTKMKFFKRELKSVGFIY
jgi:hypothetical protein